MVLWIEDNRGGNPLLCYERRLASSMVSIYSKLIQNYLVYDIITRVNITIIVSDYHHNPDHW